MKISLLFHLYLWFKGCVMVRIPRIDFDERDIRVLLEVFVEGERVKPSQVAKREVLRRYGLLGTQKDRIFTAILYGVGKVLGVIDKIIHMAIGVDPQDLDSWSRAALRIAVYLKNFGYRDEKLWSKLKIYAPIVVRDVVGFEEAWRLREYLDRVWRYSYRPRSDEEKLELQFMVSSWLVKKLISYFGRKETIAFLEASNRKPALGLRANTLKATPEKLLSEVKKFGVDAWISPYVPVVVKYRGSINYEEFEPLKKGEAIPQDDASAAASIVLDPKPNEVVVDMCAAPGGKTSHIAELMRNQGKIYAFDIYDDRIEHMKRLLEKCGITIVEVFKLDARKATEVLGEEIADKVLLDPPCSSTGAIAKHPEARWRIDDAKLNELVELQKQLLDTAVKLVKPGGRILYCVCSVLPEEGEHVIQWILNRYSDKLRLIPIEKPFSPGLIPGTMRAWPHKHNTTGFFYALLEKTSSLS